jgi:hypothetical protein
MAIENTAIMEEMFSKQSVQRHYNNIQLAAAVRELLGFIRCALLLLEASS